MAISKKETTTHPTITNVITVAILLIGEILYAAFSIITLPFQFIWQNCKDIVTTIWESIKTTVGDAINSVSNTISTVMESIKTKISTAWNNIKTTVSTILSSIGNTVSTAWNNIKNTVSTISSAIGNTVSTAWNNIKNTVSTISSAIGNTVSNAWNSINTTIGNVISSIKNTVSGGFGEIKSKADTIFSSIKSSISDKINGARDAVKSAIDKMKSFFNFSWSLPKLKLPRISISGKFGLNPPETPKFGITWHKKGAIFQSPTLFNTPYGVQGVGEAGAEAVLPIEKLSGILAETLQEMGIVGNNDMSELISVIEKLAKPININVDGKAFVKLLAPLISEELEFLSKRQLRGEGFA